MEDYKVRSDLKAKQRRILLALSFGASSMVLLHVLNQQLLVQRERTSRVGYELQVLFIDMSSVYEHRPSLDVMSLFRERYPLHSFTIVPLSDAYKYLPQIDEDSDLASFRVEGGPDPRRADPCYKSLQEFFTSLPSATSREDVTTIFRDRLIVDYAKQMDCEAVVWGDSTTRLAEKTLAETARGRGFGVPWQIADVSSPHGIKFAYPIRDLLRKEILTYSTLANPPLTPLITESRNSRQTSISSKDHTIDSLMSQYFESVEQNFPSIVANVVRTSRRLEAPPAAATSALCAICNLPIARGMEGLHSWAGEQESFSKPSIGREPYQAGQRILCYGCTRALGKA